ncbi:hypothetical protein [Mannheimia haemolytica]|uniref:hypothetical protein n=1 Tax=Mannheimia haemolytica TaxID=75985 RepID=UPI000588C7A0|nr:hypothetical protein [Mannheimia haemolytica]AJE08218.1 short-chain fatty acid transporter [Mannheimia haemolytica USDA-ARS-USMARC-184]KYL07461.1 short-chain fatty acid transporter [Mannheimia haemolytica]MDW0617747.1 short-chain fatty acid transporter [Mannheimia haemolytica]UFK42133.1 short-chain fatty acid transporter [Mannheimia haemolytica]UQX61852.1 short-chain fatty acid transporter [Mannheimia haemolytica]
MKKTTACILTFLVSSVLYANNITIELKQNDFVQGKLIQKAQQPLSLSIIFPAKALACWLKMSLVNKILCLNQN